MTCTMTQIGMSNDFKLKQICLWDLFERLYSVINYWKDSHVLLDIIYCICIRKYRFITAFKHNIQIFWQIALGLHHGTSYAEGVRYLQRNSVEHTGSEHRETLHFQMVYQTTSITSLRSMASKNVVSAIIPLLLYKYGK